MRYRVFPKGYDPMVASGPPTPDIRDLGITWTEEDTRKALALENQTTTIDHKPSVGVWYEEVKVES